MRRRAVGVDGGGSFTRAGIYEGRHLIAEAAAGGSNPVLDGAERCIATVAGLVRGLLGECGGEGLAVACGISGAARGHFSDRLARALCDGLGVDRVLVCDDIRPVLYANAGAGPGLMVIAGTGSSVVAQADGGRSEIVGGRGSLFGDYGSAYAVAVAALRATADAIDGLGPATCLAETLPGAAGLGRFADLVPWAEHASKRDIAELAKAVALAAEAGDEVAGACLDGQAGCLAAQALAGADRLHLPDDAPVYFNGGLIEHCIRFRTAFTTALAQTRLRAAPILAPLRSHRAAIELAMADRLPDGLPVSIATRSDAAAGPEVPPTERPDDAAVPLDRLDAPGIARRMNREDARVAEAVGAEIEHIARAMELAADAIASGGRLIYLGAGTSGRLGVLDASECPPTFGVDPAVVMGIIAGGERALRCSIEGAEDDAAQARADLAGQAPGLGENDVVVGITASGTTPYVLAGLRAAQEQGAACVLICCNPAQRAAAADVTIAVDTGAEVLTGSTRLKAGTATKLVLNTLSTGAMALAGYVYEGRMVGMRPVNAKLEKRAVRIVAELAGVPADEAERLLKAARGRIATAVVMGRTGIACSEAERRLERAHGRLRRALEPDA